MVKQYTWQQLFELTTPQKKAAGDNMFGEKIVYAVTVNESRIVAKDMEIRKKYQSVKNDHAEKYNDGKKKMDAKQIKATKDLEDKFFVKDVTYEKELKAMQEANAAELKVFNEKHKLYFEREAEVTEERAKIQTDIYELEMYDIKPEQVLPELLKAMNVSMMRYLLDIGVLAEPIEPKSEESKSILLVK
jgi:hypothetical protein